MRMYTVQLSTNETPTKATVFASTSLDDCERFIETSMFDDSIPFTKPPIRNGDVVEFLSDDKECRIEIVKGTFTED